MNWPTPPTCTPTCTPTAASPRSSPHTAASPPPPSPPHLPHAQTFLDDKVAKMEAAAEEDSEQHAAGRPAVQKLKMLSEVEDFLAQRKYHEMFINVGGLGVLKAWLEPYKDGSLPNVKVRSAILRICKVKHRVAGGGGAGGDGMRAAASTL